MAISGNKMESYLIYVSVIEGRHFAIQNMDSVIKIQIDKQQKTTNVQRSTDNPYFNEYFVFEFESTLPELLDKRIIFTAIQPRKFGRKRKILGYFILDVSVLWAASEHQFYHKWAVITPHPTDVKSVLGPKGYLKLDLGILTKGNIPHFPATATDEDDDIEGNLLLPEKITYDRSRANFIFNIYKAEEIPKIKSFGLKGDTLPSTCVQITFAGIKAKTSIQKNTQNPVWNERITFTELFPTLCQRIKIELIYSQSIPSVKYFIYLRYISNDGENGYLPTFGPSYIFLYGQNKIGSNDLEYKGRLMLELQTEILTDLMWSVNNYDVQPIRVVPNLVLWSIEPILLHLTIYSVTLIDKKFKGKPITFELSIGSPMNENSSDIGQVVSEQFNAIPDDKNYYCYLPFNGNAICFYRIFNAPDARRRIFNTNLIKNIYEYLEKKLKEIEIEFPKEKFKNNRENIEILFKNLTIEMKKKCNKYLSIVNKLSKPRINLDEKQLQLGKQEIKEIEKLLETIDLMPDHTKRFIAYTDIQTKIFNLIEKVQTCWPDIFLWMKCDGKKIGIYTVAIKDIIFSGINEERGVMCGKRQDVYIEPLKSPLKKLLTFQTTIHCKINLQIWIGLESEKKECLQNIPKCYEISETLPKREDIPIKLTCKQSHTFTCKVYIYQGRFIPGADDSGLSDPFVVAIFGSSSLKTLTIPKTINPTWNQALVFHNVTLCGSIEYLQTYTPVIDIEVYDKDLYITVKQEYVGRTSIIPEFRQDTQPRKDKLHSYKVYNEEEEVGEILMYAELIIKTDKKSTEKKGQKFESKLSAETSKVKTKDGDNLNEIIIKKKVTETELGYRLNTELEEKEVERIPDDILPKLRQYRMDVFFWGVHNLKKINLRVISKPKITIECCNNNVESSTIISTEAFLNFSNPYQFGFIELSDDPEYYPPLAIKMYECRGFGVCKYVGIHLANVQDFIYYPMTTAERDILLSTCKNTLAQRTSYTPTIDTNTSTKTSEKITQIKKNDKPKTVTKTKNVKSTTKEFIKKTGCLSICKKKNKKIQKDIEKPAKITKTHFSDPYYTDIEIADWWTKFFFTLDTSAAKASKETANMLQLKIYNTELESLPIYEGFNDLLRTFKIYRGKRTGDEILDEVNIIGIFTGAIRIYRWSPEENKQKKYVTETGLPLINGAFQHYPNNEPLPFIIRVYVIRAINLRPKDASGRSDPYIVVKMSDQLINDEKQYVPNQVNPVFGKCYEMKGTFPKDRTVKIEVWDFDATTKNDLIGETKIELEKRLYTNHRAHCGIAKEYIEVGPCAWRDPHKPSQILSVLCVRNRIDAPIYLQNAIKIGPCVFVNDKSENPKENVQKEILSLLALHNWNEIPIVGCNLVVEHVETRSLFHYDRPGIEQGKLQLWVDIFPSGDVPPPPPVNVTPRLPEPYELRVIIWNTDNVLLEEDDFFIGERKSDIYVKGWITGPNESQRTDVHYNSLTGEGNFNWRFVFKFDYYAAEDKIVIYKKQSVFSLDPTEYKIPCKLVLQVWDNDTFSADDFLGSLNFSLAQIPRGAKTSTLCTPKILLPDAPKINIFRTKRHKGWWPFRGLCPKTKKEIMTGKVEAEIEIFTEEEAKKMPAGLGRHEPQKLPAPKRPDVSFSWFRNPLKALAFLICKRFRFQICMFFMFVVLIVMAAVAIYAFPNYLVKRILGA